MPLYNAGTAFKTCMESLLAQTWRSLEIIIVDDGSSDVSLTLAQEYADKYDHVILVHQENGGVSAARNRGMKEATGEFIAYVDADDIVYPEMYKTLIEMIQEDDLDMAQCNSDWSYADTGKVWLSIPPERLRSTGVLSGPDWLRKALACRRWTHVVWMGVYRHESIDKTGLIFEPGLHHQDILWTTEFMFNAKRVRFTDVPLYRYFLHSQSVSRTKRTGEKNRQYQRNYIRITEGLEQLNKKYAGQIPIYPEFRRQITYEAMRVCHAIKKEPDHEMRKQMIEEVFASGMYKRMVRGACGSIKLMYQMLLWSIRFYRWRR